MRSRPSFPGWLGTARADRSDRNLGDPTTWVEPNALGDQQAAASEVGGVSKSDEAGNDRGAKGPHLVDVNSEAGDW